MNQLLSVLDINLSTVTLLLHKARQMKDLVKSKGGSSILTNKVLTSLFYEPSTRTSCSFQAAMLRLGGSVINVDVGNSSMQKGETLEDTIQTVS
jgi:aspartate carbamoyltransferase catalytic subunit